MNFKELIKTNRQNVQNIIRLITKENNEDIEQEVYIKVWKNADKYKEQGNFRTWICAIAKNLSKDYLKSARRRYDQNSTSDEVVLASIKDTKAAPELKLLQKIRQKKIMNAIDRLKPKFKEVVILCEIQGLTYEQASKKLGIPLGTIKSRLYNAKCQLAQELQDLL